MKIYTKTGDAGTTGLFAGPRVPKDHPRICTYGTVDELNAVLGLARTAPLPDEIANLLQRVQSSLFDIGAELATPNPEQHGLRFDDSAAVGDLEAAIDRWEAELPPLKTFILPGGSPAAAWLHLGRTVCRRAEREVVHLTHSAQVAECSHIIIYLNRLSDLLFVLARACNLLAGQNDVAWHSSRKVRGEGEAESVE